MQRNDWFERLVGFVVVVAAVHYVRTRWFEPPVPAPLSLEHSIQWKPLFPSPMGNPAPLPFENSNPFGAQPSVFGSAAVRALNEAANAAPAPQTDLEINPLQPENRLLLPHDGSPIGSRLLVPSNPAPWFDALNAVPRGTKLEHDPLENAPAGECQSPLESAPMPPMPQEAPGEG